MLRFRADSFPGLARSTLRNWIALGASCHSPRRISFAVSYIEITGNFGIAISYIAIKASAVLSPRAITHR